MDNGGNWHNNITTLADTCGCENGVNSLFAITNDFHIHNCDKFNEEASAISATGGAVHFKQYIAVSMQIQNKIVETRFYLMDNLPRTFLIDYPWMMKYGGIIGARKGTFSIQDFNLTVPLLKNWRQHLTETVFAAFEMVPLMTQPVHVTIPVPTCPLPAAAFQKIKPYVDNQVQYSNNMQKIFAVFDDESPTNNSSEESKSSVGDIIEEESSQALHLLLEEFAGIFDLNDTSPAHLPPIHVDMKEEYKSKRFYRPEPLNSDKEQAIIDSNAKKTDQSREG